MKNRKKNPFYGCVLHFGAAWCDILQSFAPWCSLQFFWIFFLCCCFSSLEVLVNAIALDENFHSFTRWSMVSNRTFDKHVNEKKKRSPFCLVFLSFFSLRLIFTSARPKQKLSLDCMPVNTLAYDFPWQENVHTLSDWVVLSITLTCIESFWRSYLNSDSLKPVRRYSTAIQFRIF